jgi:adenylate cyclase
MTAQAKPGWSARLGRVSARHIDLALAVLVTFTGLVLFAFSGIGGNRRAGFLFLQNIELRALDLRFALRGTRPHDDRIVIVGIDQRTLQKLGSFPLPRKSYAALVQKLAEAGARVVAFDATFPTPESNSAVDALRRLEAQIAPEASPAVRNKIREFAAASDQDAVLAGALKQSGNVVLGHLFLDQQRAKSSDPKMAEAYFNVAWAKAFPQVLKVKSKDGRDFDLGRVWVENGGTVAAGVEANIAKLAAAAASYGFIDINPDSDGTLRHGSADHALPGPGFFSVAGSSVGAGIEKIPDQEIAAYVAETGLERIQFGKHELWPAGDGTALINYSGPYRTYAQYSMADVMAGTIAPETFKDKIVLLGATALAIGDLRNTPFPSGTYMGVEVHANIIDNLLHSHETGRSFLTRGLGEEVVDAGFILLFGLAFGAWFARIKPLYSTLSLLVTLAAFGCFVYLGFAALGRWFSFVIPAGTLVANYAALTSFRMIFEEREKRKIRKTFSQYLSPGVIALIERDPQKYIRPGGDTKELTVMFSDIRGFTTLSEGMTAAELVQLLNEYLGEMTDVIFHNLGTLDKYIGDAIMAFWGSPYPQNDHALRACTCAVAMLHALEKLNAKWQAQGRKEISIGIGLNTGPVNVGHGLVQTSGLDRDGRQRQSGLASGRHDQGISHPHRDQRRNLPAGGGSLCVPRTGPDTGERQEAASSCLRTAGCRVRQTEICFSTHPLRERLERLSRAKLARGGGTVWGVAGVFPRGRPGPDLPAAGAGIHGECTRARLGRRLRNEEQMRAGRERDHCSKFRQ